MTMQKMVEILENRGFKTTKKYDSTLQKYEFIIERNGIKFADFFTYSAINSVQSEFLDRLTFNFEKIEEEKKSMKNIAFDISRDGPVGKLVIKDNVYDVCVKEVNCDRNLYNETTTLKVEVASLTNSPSERAMKLGDWAVMNFKNGMGITYNPDRKDSINEGKLQIKDVIFNPPATIVFWSDGSKTVVKAENEVYDPEKGLAMAIAKRAMGNQGNYFDTFKKYVDRYKNKIDEELAAKEAKIQAEQKKPYRIWYEDQHGNVVTFKARTYVRKGNAVRSARKMFAGTCTRWMVAQENPTVTGAWNCVLKGPGTCAG